MYSQKIIAQRQSDLEQRTGLRLVRYSEADCATLVEHLGKVYDPEKEKPKRPLKEEEKVFIRNERLLVSIDFHYWASRYCFILLDGGGLGRLNIWESQRIILDLIAKLEEEMHDKKSRGEPVDGILLAVNKARQLGATMLGQALFGHRFTTTSHIRGIMASVDDEKVMVPITRFKRILDNLPWWLRPSMGYDVKAKHMTFDKLDSMIVAQTYTQETGLGQGEQFEMGHLTEVASAPYPGIFRHDYFPTIPQNISALHILESTPQGRGNFWHDFTTECRKGHERWKFVFIPWYAEKSKYRRQPPDGWIPSEVSMIHAQKVYDTSAEFVGTATMLDKQQLYWWESTRAEYQKESKLNLFLTNYACTPEESFQHTSTSAFDEALLEHYRNHSAVPPAYEIRAL